jgi:hypothetical protein
MRLYAMAIAMTMVHVHGDGGMMAGGKKLPS